MYKQTVALQYLAASTQLIAEQASSLAERIVAIPSVCVTVIIQHCLVLTTAIYSKLAASTQLIAEQAAISGTVNLTSAISQHQEHCLTSGSVCTTVRRT